jgi:hypothetical protein
MRQVKRFFYFTVLNIIVSAVTVIVVLQLWQKNHPLVTVDTTPVVIMITPTQSINLPLMSNNSGIDGMLPVEAGIPITQTYQLNPSPEMLTYQVKEGDTIGALAVEFNVRVGDILAVNNLADPDSIPQPWWPRQLSIHQPQQLKNPFIRPQLLQQGSKPRWSLQQSSARVIWRPSVCT